MYIAMWSGPRNVSTAMLRAFGERPDTWVVDEPLYAAYLSRTGKTHPGRDEIIASQSTDYAQLAQQLTGPIPHQRRIYYQKHMAHHLLPEARGPWLQHITHCFLIRDPDEMLSSLLRVWPEAQLEDTGLPQQVALFRDIQQRTGRDSPVLDGRLVMDAPLQSLQRLCLATGIPWDPSMLSWPAGRRETDGVWARHWYGAVEASTRFTPWTPRQVQIPDHKQALREACWELYNQLAPFAGIQQDAQP